MTLTFVCQNCDESFELDYAALADGERGVRCPSCSKKLPPATVDDLLSAIDDVLGQVAGLRKRFLVSFEVDPEDLPPPYDGEKRTARPSEDDEDVDEEDVDEDAADESVDEDEDERY